MLIGNHDTNKRVLIVAEIGNNHEGDFGLAREMIAVAADSGVDAVKFQTIVPDRLVSAIQTDRINQLGRFRFSYEQFSDLASCARDNGVMFLSTPFDVDSARFLDSLVPAFKVSSPDNTFFPLLEVIAETGKPLLLSTGLCDRDELAKSLSFLRERGVGIGNDRLGLLHCVSSYPTPADEVNLLAIRSLSEFGVPGYSDHTLGIDAAVSAVAIGARIIEKHFTLDHDYSDFRDHQLSADPSQMGEMVKRIRICEAMLGQEEINVSLCEEDGRTSFRRSVVAAEDLPEGTVLSSRHIDWVRPGGGVAPGDEGLLLGKVLLSKKDRGEKILINDVESLG